VGRLVEKKGFGDLVRAAALARDRLDAVRIVGDGPLRGELERLARLGRVDLRPGGAAGPDAAAGDGREAAPGAELGLTPRELEVLVLVAEGRSNRQIADALFISVKTASVHVSNILAKLHVAGRVEAAAVAHRLGLAAGRSGP
jgi:DNA-binding CsgD family transcriptional regulator